MDTVEVNLGQSLSFKLQAKAFRMLPNANPSVFDFYINIIKENGLNEFLQNYVGEIPIYPQTQKFNDDPKKLFEGNIIVIAKISWSK